MVTLCGSLPVVDQRDGLLAGRRGCRAPPRSSMSTAVNSSVSPARRPRLPRQPRAPAPPSRAHPRRPRRRAPRPRCRARARACRREAATVPAATTPTMPSATPTARAREVIRGRAATTAGDRQDVARRGRARSVVDAISLDGQQHARQHEREAEEPDDHADGQDDRQEDALAEVVVHGVLGRWRRAVMVGSRSMRLEAGLEVTPVQAVGGAALLVGAPAEEHDGDDAPDEESGGDLHQQAGDLLVGDAGRAPNTVGALLVGAVQQALAEGQERRGHRRDDRLAEQVEHPRRARTGAAAPAAG